jgi:hypothetical protein
MRAGSIATLSRPLATGLLVAVLTTAGIAHSEGESVSIEPSRSMYSAGEAAEFTVTNSGSAPVFVSGCGALQLEHFESEHYLPVRAETCVSEGTALEIAPGTQTLTLAPSGRKGGEILRVGLSYGWGCESGRALSQARCSDFKTVYSSSFRIGRGDGE